MDYLDFEIEIGHGDGRNHPVSVRTSAGDARGTMRFPFDDFALEDRLKDLRIALLSSSGERRRIPSDEEKAVQDFGLELFNALVKDDVRSLYDAVRREAGRGGKGMRVKLRILSPGLAALPWEFLYDPRQNEYVCLSLNTPVVRYLELTQAIEPLTVTPPLRILGLIASPNDLPKLNIDRERKLIETALEELQTKGLVELHWVAGQTWRDLQKAMRGGPWHIFHFIGHGKFDRNADEGLIALADEHGDSHHLRASQLALLLADHQPLRFVLLNACEGARGGGRDIFSSTASILVSRNIPAVVAMQSEITDRAAIEFARTFYDALAEGWPVDTAVGEARKSIRVAIPNTVEWGTPVLYLRSADGKLFDIRAQAAEPAAKEQPVKDSAEPRVTQRVEPEQPDILTIERPFHLELVRIPAGEFLMGSDPKKDKDAFEQEQPQHCLHLSEFHISKYPITNAQYAAFTKIEIPAGRENHPVVNVSWHNAVAFCKWLSQQTGKHFRLPTEAEWEKAARGTDGRIYPWGNQWDETKSNFRTDENPMWELLGSTTPVDSYSPEGDSLYGVADMIGNVWEWTSSLWGKDGEKPDYKYPYNPKDGRENMRALDDVDRIMRGGSWRDFRDACRAAVRVNSVPEGFSYDLSFRVALSPVEQLKS